MSGSNSPVEPARADGENGDADAENTPPAGEDGQPAGKDGQPDGENAQPDGEDAVTSLAEVSLEQLFMINIGVKLPGRSGGGQKATPGAEDGRGSLDLALAEGASGAVRCSWC